MTRFVQLVHALTVFVGGGVIGLSSCSDQAWGQSCCFGSNRAPAYPVGPPVPIAPTAPAGTAMNSYYGGYGTLPPSPGTLFPAGLPQSNAAFLPTAAYDTRWLQTPVTYYRPVTQFDPNYGTTVTSLQPCTSYQYQAARVPLVSPRMIGDYSYSANRWPAVATPSYYPNNVIQAGSVPNPAAYPTLQQLPAIGTPVTSNRMSQATTGTSSGPASTLPLATMGTTNSGFVPQGFVPQGVVSANHLAPMAIPSTMNSATPATAWMPATPTPMAQVPITSAIPGTGTPIYTVPANVSPSSLTPCPNGLCAPSVPGAASVVPLGPPTVMSPSPTPMATSPVVPGATNPILPNMGDIQPVMPPSGSNDPEATRPPSLGSSAAMFPMKRIPVAEFQADNTAPFPSTQPVTVPSVPQETRSQPTAPQILPPTTLQPLKVPSDFDAKPRWNPKLLPPANPATRETVASTQSRSCVTV